MLCNVGTKMQTCKFNAQSKCYPTSDKRCGQIVFCISTLSSNLSQWHSVFTHGRESCVHSVYQWSHVYNTQEIYTNCFSPYTRLSQLAFKNSYILPLSLLNKTNVYAPCICQGMRWSTCSMMSTGHSGPPLVISSYTGVSSFTLQLCTYVQTGNIHMPTGQA